MSRQVRIKLKSEKMSHQETEEKNQEIVKSHGGAAEFSET